MDEMWKYGIALIVGMLIMKLVFIPSSELEKPINKYSEMNRFIIECKVNEENLGSVYQELNQLKNTNLFKENEKLEVELSNCRGGYPLFIFFNIIMLIIFSLVIYFFIYFFINKYQNNKISELEDKFFESQKEIENKKQELENIKKEFDNYKSRKKRR